MLQTECMNTRKNYISHSFQLCKMIKFLFVSFSLLGMLEFYSWQNLLEKELVHTYSYFLLYNRKYWFRANFRHPFLFFFLDLHVLECPEHDLTISGKCLSVCVSACVHVCVCVTRILWQVQLKNFSTEFN